MKPLFVAFGCAIALGLTPLPPLGVTEAADPMPLKLGSARVTIAGHSNIDEFTASTLDARVVELTLKPGAKDVFAPGDIVVRAASLTTFHEGFDRDLHAALKTALFPDVTFSLSWIEPAAAIGTYRAVGILQIAGVEQEVALDLQATYSTSAILVNGKTTLKMTDFGITPPSLFIGLVQVSPTITVTFETVFVKPTT
jgi:polyisoprenoid-binding protein YceI